MRLNTRHLYLENKGFTLVELILVLGIFSIIMLPMYSIMNLTTNAYTSLEENDELLLNARFAVEYIKKEIRSADIVVSADKIKNLKAQDPTNIGFLLVFIKGDKHQYITYHLKDREIVRLSTIVNENTYPKWDSFFKNSGYNKVCKLVYSINDTRIDFENSMINLDFVFSNSSDSKSFFRTKADIFIRSNIDY